MRMARETPVGEVTGSFTIEEITIGLSVHGV
jgi:hypothetical protein